MKEKKLFIKDKKKLRILIAPLDWGLGHATRCIPIINELIQLGCEVVIVADNQPFFLLKKEFPNLVFLRCKGYEIEYSQQKTGFFTKMFLQVPKLFFAIRNEKKWLQKIAKGHYIDAVISDNRFGMYCKNIPSIFITHQLFINTGNSFVDFFVQKINNFFIKKYSNCWVPDFKENGFAGKLSHPRKISSKVIYMGPLSRFEALRDVANIYDLLVSISGPEPQRTIFENMILSELQNYPGKVLMVRGLPGEKKELNTPNDSIKIVNHLSSEELNRAFEQSKMVICRSGYTTIMDLVKLKKKAIFVPTPGQTEQEYLAKHLFEKKYFYSIEQKKFSLSIALKNNAGFSPQDFNTPLNDYKKVIAGFVATLKYSM
ncbi:MAG: glycosyltransferase [Bacteroidota bacterium]|nr:glycosyltransferase [Bacteroidota bacterium]